MIFCFGQQPLVANWKLMISLFLQILQTYPQIFRVGIFNLKDLACLLLRALRTCRINLHQKQYNERVPCKTLWMVISWHTHYKSPVLRGACQDLVSVLSELLLQARIMVCSHQFHCHLCRERRSAHMKLDDWIDWSHSASLTLQIQKCVTYSEEPISGTVCKWISHVDETVFMELKSTMPYNSNLWGILVLDSARRASHLSSPHCTVKKDTTTIHLQTRQLFPDINKAHDYHDNSELTEQ